MNSLNWISLRLVVCLLLLHLDVVAFLLSAVLVGVSVNSSSPHHHHQAQVWP